MPSKYEYSLLHDQIEEDCKEGLKPSGSRRIWASWRMTSLYILSSVFMFVVGLLASHLSVLTTQGSCGWSSATIHHDNSIIPSKASTTTIIDGIEVAGTQCGHSWQEAKAMGCHFDVMASRWYSPECFDQEVLDEMLAEPQVDWNFTWYAGKAHTVVVPSEIVFNGEFDKVYPNNLFHIKHCLYLWRKLHHAVLTGRPVDEDILDYEHTIHCTKMIMGWTDPNFKRHSVTSAKSATPFCRSTPVGLLGTEK